MSSLDNMIQQVNELINTGKYEDAIPVFQQILETDPGNMEMLYYYAMTNVELENFDEAENILHKALEIENDNTDCLLQVGYLKHQKNEIDEAKNIFSKILAIDPMHSDAFQMLGLIAMDEEDFKSAIDYLEASYASEEDYDVMFKIIECYLDLGQLEKAFENLETLDSEKFELEQYDTNYDLRTKYYLDKTIESWTGISKDENGNINYFPATLDELLDGERNVEMAKIQKSKDEFYQERISLFEEVLQTNREKLTGSPIKPE